MKIGLKKEVSGLLAGLLLTVAASASWGQTVYIGAVPAIQVAMTDPTNGIIAAFKAANPTYAGYTFSFTWAPSGTLKSNIATALAASNPSPYDLLLAANTADTVFSPTYSVIGTPKNYAEGTIMLWSNGDAYSIDANTAPATFASTYTNTGICNTTMGPYGVVAQDVLTTVYGITTPSNPQVVQYANINSVDAAIQSGGGGVGGVQSGWVPTSLHCSAGSITLPNSTFPNATYQAFTPDEGGYQPAIQAGVVITRTGGETTAAQALLNWMGTTAGQEAFQYYCLEINSEARLKAKRAQKAKIAKMLKVSLKKH
jgi:hypothetical protein